MKLRSEKLLYQRVRCLMAGSRIFHSENLLVPSMCQVRCLQEQYLEAQYLTGWYPQVRYLTGWYPQVRYLKGQYRQVQYLAAQCRLGKSHRCQIDNHSARCKFLGSLRLAQYLQVQCLEERCPEEQSLQVQYLLAQCLLGKSHMCQIEELLGQCRFPRSLRLAQYLELCQEAHCSLGLCIVVLCLKKKSRSCLIGDCW